MTTFKIDAQSSTPPFEQIKQQISSQSADGTIAANTKLPTVRQLAADLSVAPGTVARAYRELEELGILETRGRHGTFVTENARATLDVHQREQLLTNAAVVFATAARQADASSDQAIQAFLKAFEV